MPKRTFADMKRMMRELAKVPAQVATSAADGIAEDIQSEFDHGIDPYGSPWEALAQGTLDKGREEPPLTDTGAMRESVRVEARPGAGIAVTIDDPAVHHQYGTVHMPQRAPLPNHGIPDTWKRRIADASEEAFDRAAGGYHA